MAVADNFKKAIDLMNKSSSWLVTSHTRPDGDAVGCMKALCEIASQLGKKAKPLLLSPPAEWYKFIFAQPVPVLGNDVKLEELKAGKFGSFDLVIIVDTNSYVQLAEFDKWLKISKIPVLVIDHHLTGDNLGTVEIIDSTAAATGEIVLDLLEWPAGKLPNRLPRPFILPFRPTQAGSDSTILTPEKCGTHRNLSSSEPDRPKFITKCTKVLSARLNFLGECLKISNFIATIKLP